MYWESAHLVLTILKRLIFFDIFLHIEICWMCYTRNPMFSSSYFVQICPHKQGQEYTSSCFCNKSWGALCRNIPGPDKTQKCNKFPKVIPLPRPTVPVNKTMSKIGKNGIQWQIRSVFHLRQNQVQGPSKYVYVSIYFLLSFVFFLHLVQWLHYWHIALVSPHRKFTKYYVQK